MRWRPRYVQREKNENRTTYNNSLYFNFYLFTIEYGINKLADKKIY